MTPMKANTVISTLGYCIQKMISSHSDSPIEETIIERYRTQMIF